MKTTDMNPSAIEESMSGMDVIRERIARTLWAKDGQLPRWDEVPLNEGYRLHYYRDTADAVIAALGLEEERNAPGYYGNHRYVTPWEWIEGGA